MGIKKRLIHFNDITLALTEADLKAALIAKYGDAAAEVLGDGVLLQSAHYSDFTPADGVVFTFAQPLKGHGS